MRAYRQILSIILLSYLFSAIPLFSQTNDDRDQRFLNALYILGDKKPQQAKAALKKLINDHPQYSNSYRSLAGIFITYDQLAEGHAYFTGLIKRDHNNPYAYYGLARINYYQQDKEAALQNLKTCISLQPDYSESYGPFEGIVDVFRDLNRLVEGIAYFEALIEQNPQQVNAYYGLGRAYLKANEKEKGLELMNKVIDMKPDHKYAYHELIYLNETKGLYKDELLCCKKLIDISIRENDLAEAAYGYTKYGGVYFYTGDYQQALTVFNKALQLSSKIGSLKYESLSINNLGAVYATLGDFKMARKYFIHSLGLMEKDGTEVPKIRILLNIGLISKDLQDFENGIIYLKKGLALAEKTKIPAEKTALLSGLGEIYFELGNYEQSLNYFRQAYKLANALNDIMYHGYTARNLGTLYLETGDFSQAIDFFSEALLLGNKMRDAQIRWEAEAGLGATYQQVGQINDATRHLSAAIAIFDSIRQNLDFETLGSAFLADKYEAYPSLIRLYAEAEQYEKAFSILEKYKSSSLLKLITKGQLLSSLLPDSVLVNLQNTNNELVEYHFKLSDAVASGQTDEQVILELDTRIKELQLRQTAIKNSLKNDYKALYQITSAKQLSLKDAQTAILNDNQVMLEYVVGPQSIVIFAISRDSVLAKSIELPRTRLKKMFSQLSPIFRLDNEQEKANRPAFINADVADFSVQDLAEFYDMLIRPVAPALADKSELIIIPDDLLFYLPFEALISDTSKIENRYDFGAAKFLIEDYSISYAASASLFSRELQTEQNPKYDLLAFGNPDYSTHLAKQGSDSSSAVKQRERFIQLPNSETEVKLIGKELNPKKSKIFTGTEASESRLKSDASDYRILHLATHFTMNDFDPLYSRIVLSREQDSAEDGFLQPYEIFHLRLNASLVVLSACNTASGKLNKGEGLVGLTRAFQYAGVPSLLVSLWNVDDKATSDIMGYFYSYMRVGLTKNEALRKAKLDYLKSSDADHKDPFYWAPFVLIGDFNKLPLDQASDYPLKSLLAIFVLFAGVAIFMRVRRNKTA